MGSEELENFLISCDKFGIDELKIKRYISENQFLNNLTADGESRNRITKLQAIKYAYKLKENPTQVKLSQILLKLLHAKKSNDRLQV